MTHEIEKGIPLPPPDRKFPTNNKYNFAKMEIGDSIFDPLLPGQPRSRIVAAACAWNTHNKPKKLASRKVEGGYRVWRVK